jgi:hypothetical protein
MRLSNNRITIPKILSRIFITFLLLLLVLTANLSHAAPADELTPLQQSIADTFNQRMKNGLQIPPIGYQSQSSGTLNFSKTPDVEPFTMTATTIIEFAGPQQAGFEVWPAIVTPQSLTPDEHGQIALVDNTEAFRQAIEQQAPEILDTYEFGHEPRTLRITERLVYQPVTGAVTPLATGNTSTSENILLGFTYTGPNAIQYAPAFELCVGGGIVPQVCASLVIGYELSWALGLRLPAQVTLSGPQTVGEWESYSLSARLNGLNWSQAQYENAGLPGEHGNEFVGRFTGRVFAEITLPIFGTDTIERGLSFDLGRSFQTPFGTNARFPIPPIEYIPLVSFPVFGIINVNLGAGLDFMLSSTNITANWHALTPTNANGQGEIAFTRPNQAVSIGPVQVNDMPPNQIEIELHDFRYWFNYFEIGVSLKVFISMDTLFGTLKSPTFALPLFTVDLSDIIGDLGLYVEDHVACTWDFNCAPAGPDNALNLTTQINNINAAPARNYNPVDSATLTWQPITWAVSYQVQIADNLAFDNASTYDAGYNLQYPTPTLPTGRYYWRVHAQRANGKWGNWGQIDTFVIDLD